MTRRTLLIAATLAAGALAPLPASAGNISFRPNLTSTAPQTPKASIEKSPRIVVLMDAGRMNNRESTRPSLSEVSVNQRDQARRIVTESKGQRK